MRADQLLVRRGLASSRTAAQRLIAAGRLHADGRPVARPSDPLHEAARLSVTPGDEDRFVSRGGLKLAAALAASGVDPDGRVCLDVGQSTGGFTDCLLEAGALHVVGVDVGHDQLHARLRADPRVTALEGINARAIAPATLGTAMPADGFTLIVVDVSFISLTLVLPALTKLAAEDADLIALVKPQFEAGRDALDRRGVVTDARHYPVVRDKVTACVSACGWRPAGWFDSPIAGGEGNREFLLHARAARTLRGMQPPDL